MTAPQANGPRDPSGAAETRALVERIRAGDVDAFRGLFESHYEPLRRYAQRLVRSREEAEDVVHDVFLRVWRQRERLDPGCRLRSYLYAATRNRALDALRRGGLEQRRRGEEDPAGDVADPAADADVEAAIELAERAAAVRRAVEALPARQRQVVVLRWLRQRSYAQIAAELRIAEKTVEIHMTRALQRLRSLLASLRG